DTVRVNELGAANNQLGWVVINDLADAKAQCGAGVAVSATPHFACSCRCITVAAAHALSLDALAWVDISGARLSHQSLATGDNFAVDAAGDLKCSVDALASDALNGNLDFVVKLHHAVHRVGPADNGAMLASEVLSGGRQPHAVHRWCFEDHQARGVGCGVDGVVVARTQRKWGHIRWCGDIRAVHEGTWSGLYLVLRLSAAPCGSWNRDRSTGCAATDGEALHLGCHDFLGLRVAQFQFNS